MSAALGPPPPMRMSSGPSKRNENPARGFVELHRRDADIHDDAVERHGVFGFGDLGQLGETAFDQRETAVHRIDKARAAGDGGPIAVNADDAAIGRLKHQP